MKASSALAITGLAIKELPILLSELSIKTSWQAITAQNKRFMAGHDVDNLLSESEAEKLIAALESPKTDMQKKASRVFNEVAPLFRGFKKEVAQSFSELPQAQVSGGDNWLDDMMNSSGGQVQYNRSSFEGENAGVTEIEI